MFCLERNDAGRCVRSLNARGRGNSHRDRFTCVEIGCAWSSNCRDTSMRRAVVITHSFNRRTVYSVARLATVDVAGHYGTRRLRGS
jgi:hypothetical protein